MVGVPPHRQPAQHKCRAEFGDDHSDMDVMRRAADADHEQAERAAGQRRADEVEAMGGPRRLRHRLQSDRNRQHADRNVDRKQPRPGAERQDAGGDRRAGRGCGGHHQRVVAKTAAHQAARIDEADQRAVDAHHAAGAKSLQRARHQQALERPRAGAGQRCQREQHQSGEINPLVADDLAERAERQQRRHQHDLVDIDDPDHVGRADVQVGRNGGQRDIGNRRVERSHRKRREDRRDRPAPALRRQAV